MSSIILSGTPSIPTMPFDTGWMTCCISCSLRCVLVEWASRPNGKNRSGRQDHLVTWCEVPQDRWSPPNPARSATISQVADIHTSHSWHRCSLTHDPTLSPSQVAFLLLSLVWPIPVYHQRVLGRPSPVPPPQTVAWTPVLKPRPGKTCLTWNSVAQRPTHFLLLNSALQMPRWDLYLHLYRSWSWFKQSLDLWAQILVKTLAVASELKENFFRTLLIPYLENSCVKSRCAASSWNQTRDALFSEAGVPTTTLWSRQTLVVLLVTVCVDRWRFVSVALMMVCFHVCPVWGQAGGTHPVHLCGVHSWSSRGQRLGHRAVGQRCLCSWHWLRQPPRSSFHSVHTERWYEGLF